jgi:hypothetical protein
VPQRLVGPFEIQTVLPADEKMGFPGGGGLRLEDNVLMGCRAVATNMGASLRLSLNMKAAFLYPKSSLSPNPRIYISTRCVHHEKYI